MATGDVTVTKADRERMAAYISARLHPGSRDIGGVHAAHIAKILAGDLDNGPLMQALAAHRLAAIPDGWRPIETAPAFDGFTRVVIVGGRFDCPEIVLSDGDYWRTEGLTRVKPTHWMPLPAAPEPQP